MVSIRPPSEKGIKGYSMKKLLCILLCFLLLIPAALADTPPVRLSEDDPLYTSLLERSMELAGLFNEALHSEDYLSRLQILDDLKEELALVQMQDFTQPLDVTIVRTEDAFAMYQGNDPYIMLFSADVSPALKAITWQKLYNGAGATLAGQSGISTLALSSLLSFSDAYTLPEGMDMPCFAVMQYGGLYAYLVTFYPTANGTVIANAQFIPSSAADELNMPTE